MLRPFAELVPDEFGRAILALAERPELLAEQLGQCEQTLVHGDVRLANLGVPDDRVVLIDWGERTGFAPAPVELASFLVFDAPRLDVSRDDIIADFRILYGDRSTRGHCSLRSSAEWCSSVRTLCLISCSTVVMKPGRQRSPNSAGG